MREMFIRPPKFPLYFTFSGHIKEDTPMPLLKSLEFKFVVIPFFLGLFGIFAPHTVKASVTEFQTPHNVDNDITQTQQTEISKPAEKKATQTTYETVVEDAIQRNLLQRDGTVNGLAQERSERDRQANQNPFAITQHRRNYILPFTYVTNPNNITIDGLSEESIDNTEATFQVSIKTPLFLKDDNNSGVFFGFTSTSFWQVYNTDASKPFRETNYEPEIFYQWTPTFDVLGYDFNVVQVGFNHHSNGQDGLKSRSWNRLFFTALFSDESTAYYFKTWYRIPENEKTDPLDPTGDDNPDITDFFGRAEVGFVYQLGDVKLWTSIRNNLEIADNRSSIQLNFTYPINERFDFLIQYFNGYGDSLIDYNRHQQRFGMGVELRVF